VLMSKEDVFVQVRRKGPDGKERMRWVSARAEANRLLATMAPKGLPFYEVLYGAQAKSKLDDAKKTGDPQILAEVAQRYFHTDAGAEATDLLGTYHLDRGRPLMAALCYKRLLEREGADALGPLALFKAALAFRLSGDPVYAAGAQETMQRLTARLGGEGLHVGDETIGLDQLKQELASSTPADNSNRHDWPVFRGDLSRSARGQGSDPFLEDRWHKVTIGDVLHEETQHWIEEALPKRSRPETLLPSFFPIAAGGKLIYRGYDTVHVVDIKTGELLWNATGIKASLDALAGDPERTRDARAAWDAYRQSGNPNILFENSNAGTLSTDTSRVYAVDDLVLPPHPSNMQNQNWAWGGGMHPPGGKLQELSQRSRLIAYDLETGKLLWEQGDPGKQCHPDLADSYFLGPPLPLGGRLFVLTERNSELRLVCLDAGKGEPTWTQTLATTRVKLANDVTRRVQAVHLAYAEGILVCPTNAGAILGVDLLSRSLVWAFPYREKSKAPETHLGPRFAPNRRFNAMGGLPGQDTADLQRLNSGWKMTSPVIAEGKVVFTAPDGGSIHCLNLQDGDSLWQAERRDDLYLAGVFQGKVVLVGKNTCRALSLADGKQQLWQVETGLPSGLGVASGSFYYLPLRKGAVCKIDMDKGQVVATSPAPRGEVPGNLIFYEGDVISQSESGVTVFDQVESKVAQIDARLQKNAQDPIALTQRGEMRLYKGDLPGAVADLHLALNNAPPADMLAKTQLRLFTTLTELMHNDFGKAEQYLNEYKSLCLVSIPEKANAEEKLRLEKEQRRRQAGYLSLLARGREGQGRVLDAFRAYIEYSVAADPTERVSVINDPAVMALPVVWARGRIAALAASASPEQRRLLDDEVTKRWKEVESSKEAGDLQRFADTFGPQFEVGRRALLALAERETEKQAYIKAERYLLELAHQHFDEVMSGRAVESLAQLAARQGLLDDAMYYYRILRRDFAKTVIRDGKSGADIYRELTTDKRFLPYLDDAESMLLGGTVKASEVLRSNPQQGIFPYEERSELLPFFQRRRLAWTTTNSGGGGILICQLKLLDRDTDKLIWSLPASGARVTFNHNYINAIRFPYYTSGHLTVLYLGHTVCALDLVKQRKLWEKNLIGPDHPGANQPGQTFFTLDADGSIILANIQANVSERVAQLGPVNASYIALRTPEGLSGLDPVEGKTLWIKSDIAPNTQMFGDDEMLYLVEIRNEKVVSARAVRGCDGSEVKVPDFSFAFQHRQRIIGGRLLVSEPAANGSMTLRLYDVFTGKDLWKKAVAANSIMLRSELPNLAGVVEPDGALTVLDLATNQEVFHAQVKTSHLPKVNDGLLLADAKQYYVILNFPTEANAGPFDNLGSLRAEKINGTIYAFNSASGKVNWYLQVFHQKLLLEQFADMPMLVFSAIYNQSVNVPNSYTRVTGTLSVDKRTGKRLYDKEQAAGYPTSVPQTPFHGLRIDRQNGVIDLISNNACLRHTVSAPGAKVPSKEGGVQLNAKGESERALVGKASPQPLVREVK
jgi:outer membrane protein assembly factor BamB